MRIAFIVQRYGTEILGGAEHHCRLVAERLATRHQVEVLTTCAREYTTWANEYPEGADRVRGVTVRRFATARTRDTQAFNRLSERLYHEKHTSQDELEWLKQQGPWSPALVEYLQRHHQAFDVLVFFTYLYAPTVLGIKVAPSKSLLVPTAHDEPPMQFEMYKDVFGSAAAIAWNTEAERRFVSGRFTLRTVVEDVVGCGVELPEGEAIHTEDAEGAEDAERRTRSGGAAWSGDDDDEDVSHAGADTREPLAPHLEGPANAFRRRHRVHQPFVLYGGRIEPGKGCEELLEYFQTYVRENGDATLMLMGVKMMPLPEDPHVRFAGMLPDEERLHALEAATVVVVPSPHESLSLLALEAMAVGTPVLVNARSEVLVDHCRQSQAGLYYADRWEFTEALKLLMRDADLRAALGRNGKSYINRHYRWHSILRKYERLFARIAAPVSAPPPPGPRERPRERPPSQDRGGDRNRGRGGRNERDRGRRYRGRA